MSRKLAVIGLGYVGLPVAISFGKKQAVVGFDVSERRIQALQAGQDHTGEVSSADLKASKVQFTTQVNDLKAADFFIVAVPTPVDEAHQPDLSLLKRASESVGQALKKGDIVVYESTVYPGVTEDECVPVLEKVSGLKFKQDFEVGYSPERINPGDTEHTFEKITKVVAASSDEALKVVSNVYGSVVTAGVHRAGSIQAAEMAKVIENTQRDLNIALMNEIAVLCDHLGIDTGDVLAASRTKWNFLPFSPGLVGGHCIGVDPYYLTHKAEKIGYHPQVILAGRRINDGMGKYIAARTVKELVNGGLPVRDSLVTIMGLTFKENCPDTRNTRVVDVIRELREFGIRTQICDPWADPMEVKSEYGLELTPISSLKSAAGLVGCVAHRQFREMAVSDVTALLDQPGVVVDVKSIWSAPDFRRAGLHYWRL